MGVLVLRTLPQVRFSNRPPLLRHNRPSRRPCRSPSIQTMPSTVPGGRLNERCKPISATRLHGCVSSTGARVAIRALHSTVARSEHHRHEHRGLMEAEGRAACHLISIASVAVIAASIAQSQRTITLFPPRPLRLRLYLLPTSIT